MKHEVQQKQAWFAPKLVTFGEVNALTLTKVTKYINVGDGVIFGIAISPNPGYPGEPSSGFVSI